MYLSREFLRKGVLAVGALAMSPVFAHEGHGAHIHAFLSDAGESPVSGLVAVALLTGLVVLLDAVAGKVKRRLAKSRESAKRGSAGFSGN